MAAVSGLTKVLTTTLLCSLAPLVWLIEGLAISSQRAPMWQALADPAYVYLENSVEVATGLPSFANQHPGTPLYLVMALVDRTFHLLTGSGSSVQSDVVARAESYLTVNSIVLLLLECASLLAVGVVFARKFGLGSAVIGQAAALSLLSLQDTLVSPVPLQIAISLMLLAAVGPAFDGLRRPTSTSRLILIGALLALGVTAKLTFIPALALPLLLYHRRQLLAIYFSCIGVALVVVLTTVRGELLDSAVWWRNFLLTTGRTPGDASSGSRFDALREMPSIAAHWTPVVFAALATIAACLVVRKTRGQSKAPPWVPWRAILACGLVSVLVLVSTLKTFRPWDLILITIASSAVLAVSWSWLTTASITRSWLRFLRAGVPWVVLALASASVLSSLGDASQYGRTSPEYQELVSYAEELTNSGRPVVTAYGIFTPGTALYFGQWLSQRSLAPEIVDRYPNWFEYRLDNGRFYRFTDTGEMELTCAELRQLADAPAGLTWIPGRTIEFADDQPQYKHLDTEPIASFGLQTVYRITNVSCPAD